MTDSGSGSPRRGWIERRREKIAAEIQRNRRGEYRVPTWVLAVVLAAIITAWIIAIILT